MLNVCPLLPNPKNYKRSFLLYGRAICGGADAESRLCHVKENRAGWPGQQSLLIPAGGNGIPEGAGSADLKISGNHRPSFRYGSVQIEL